MLNHQLNHQLNHLHLNSMTPESIKPAPNSKPFSKYNFIKSLTKEGLKRKQAEIIADAIKNQSETIDTLLTRDEFISFMEKFENKIEDKFDKKLGSMENKFDERSRLMEERFSNKMELMENRMVVKFGAMTAGIVTFVIGGIYTLSLIFGSGNF